MNIFFTKKPFTYTFCILYCTSCVINFAA